MIQFVCAIQKKTAFLVASSFGTKPCVRFKTIEPKANFESSHTLGSKTADHTTAAGTDFCLITSALRNKGVLKVGHPKKSCFFWKSY
jgi:hypothetical protein